MKQFALFAWDTYDPEGGWHDFRGSYDTSVEATTIGNVLTGPQGRFSRYQIVDLSTGNVMVFV